MDVFSVAAAMLGGISLSPSQLANLRAINTAFYLQMEKLLRAGGGPDAGRELTPEENQTLRSMLVEGILDTLSPEQRRALDERTTGSERG